MAWIVKPEVAELGMVPILAQAPLLQDETWLFPKAQDSWPESDLACHSKVSISLLSSYCVRPGISEFPSTAWVPLCPQEEERVI